MKLALALAAMAGAATAPARPADDASFLAFPMATAVSSASVPAFAWLVRQGGDSKLMFARAPDFRPVKLFARSDADGQPITGIATSPDGRFVAFQTGIGYGGSGDAFNPASLVETPKVAVWLVATTAGAEPVRIGAGAAPAFSPDGKRMIYRQGRDLWAVDLADTAAKPALLVPGGGGFEQAVWTRDGRTAFFVQDRGGWSFLGRHALGEDRVTWLVTGADRLTSPVLSPDGKTVAYLRWPGREHSVGYDPYVNQPVAVETVEIATGAVRTLYRPAGKAGPTDSGDLEGHLRWADDRNLVFRSEEDGWARLYAIPRAGGSPRAITPGKCEVAESELVSPDTLFVVHNCRNLDTRQLSRVTVSTGREQPIASTDVVLGLAGAVGDGRYVAFTGSTAQDAPLLRVLDLESGRLAFAERPADYGYTRRYKAPDPEIVHLKASDGETVPAQLFLPATKGPHPALVYVHGGPRRQMFPAFHFGTTYARDYALNRRLAELGYVVISINFRSGVGYGRAFREAPGRGWQGVSEYADVLGAGRWLAQRQDVDPKRIGIWGGSYGGLLTGHALTRNSDLFAAGVAGNGVYDWSWSSPIPGHQNPSAIFGIAETDRPKAFRNSPLANIDGWKSPVLLYSGDRDMNVDVIETIDLNRKLRDKGVDVRTVIVPGEAHSMIRHSGFVSIWQAMRAFLREKLGE